MGHKIRVDLEFNANTSKAKTQMQDLQRTLNSAISASASTPLGVTPQIEAARRSAMDLKMALQGAMNVETGKLNLNKFQAQLAASGKSLKQLAADMRMLGPEGVKAFNQMAAAVSQADTKLFSLSAGMNKLAHTLTNTIRWQLASTAIQGVTSAIRNTIQFAADLDKSLTRIQVVTNNSSEEMARFAKQANKAAKELSIATTKYTDASLIYYQQGLNNQAVKERTDTTVKLAAVSGKTAAEVSEWMTAIWNNFDDGSQSLQSYADKLTALGAATASSADEIAGGLEKFAAVAETVGLSYDYAAAALATITAQTRQSEDVVGTSLKTIFARMESLKLGEVLEDGTTAGQYAAQMEKVGVSIKDASGQLKDMDVILDELGARWETLARDEQIALAQGVAGIRQYNQFIALMDNWDIMQDNVKIAEQANGTLEQQFAIWEDSAEGHKQRMQASADSLKAVLLGGEDLKGYYSFMADFLEIITKLLDSLGGLPTILLGIATALAKTHQPQLISFFQQMGMAAKNTFNDIRHFSKLGTSAQNFKNEVSAENRVIQADVGGEASSSFATQNHEINQALLRHSSSMTVEAQQRAKWEFEILQAMQGQVVAAEQLRDKSLSEMERGQEDMQKLGISGATSMAISDTASAMGGSAYYAQHATESLESAEHMKPAERKDALAGIYTTVEEMQASAGELGSSSGFASVLEEIQRMSETGQGDIQKLIERIQELQQEIDETGQKKIDGLTETAMGEIGNSSAISHIDGRSSLSNIQGALADTDASQLSGEDKTRFEALQKEAEAISQLDKKSGEYKTRVSALGKDVKKFATSTSLLSKKQLEGKKAIESTTKSATKYGKTAKMVDKEQKKLEKSGKRLEKIIKNGGKGFNTFAGGLARGLGTLGQAAMSLNMLTSSVESFAKALKGEGDWTDWLTFLTTFGMSMSGLIPLVTQVAGGAGKIVTAIGKKVQAQKAAHAEDQKEIAMQGQKKAASDIEQAENLESAGTEEIEAIAQDKSNDEALEGTVLDTVEGTTEQLEAKGSQDAAKGELIEGQAQDKSNTKGLMGIGVNLGKLFSKGPVGWALGAVATTLTVGALAAFGIGKAISASAKKGSAEAEEEKQAEEDEQTLSTYEATKEETNKHGELINDYRDLLRTYKETGEGKDDLIAKAKELAEAYDLEEGALLELTGDYDAYTAAINKARAAELAKAKTDTELAGQVLTNNLEDSMRSGIGYKDSNTGKYGLSLGKGTSSSDEGGMLELFQQYGGKRGNGSSAEIGVFASNKGQDDEKGKSGWSYNEVLKGVNMEDPEEWLWAYDTLMEIYTEASKDQDIVKNSEMYKELGEWLAKSREDAEALRANREAYADFNAEEMVLNNDVGNITDLDEYLDTTGVMFDEVAGSTFKTEALTKALGNSGVNPMFELIRQGIEAQSKDIDEANIANKDEFKGKLTEAYKNGSEAMVRALAMTEIEDGMTWDEFEDKVQQNLVAGAQAAKIATASEYKISEAQANTYTAALKAARPEIAKYAEEGTELAYVYELISARGIELNAELEKLTQIWDDNADALLNSSQGSTEYAYALANMNQGFQELLGTDVDLTEFISTNTDRIKAFMNGEKGVYEKLALDMAEVIAKAKGNFTMLEGVFSDLRNNPLALGEVVDDSAFYTKLQTALSTGEYTATELQAIFTAAGYAFDYSVEAGFSNFRRVADNAMAETSKTLEERRKEWEKKLEEARKSVKDDKDRYRDINEELEDIERNLSKIQTKKDRAFGKDKIKWIQAEKVALEEQIKAQEKYIAAIQKTKEEQYQEIDNYGFTFDENGRILNYDAVYDAMSQKYLAGLESSQGDDTAIEKWEQWWEDFKTNTDNYSDTLDLLEDEQTALDDLIYSREDLNYEELEYQIELKTLVDDSGLKAIEFALGRIEDDAYAAAQAIGLLGQQAELNMSKFKINEQGIRDLLAMKGATEDQIQSFMNGNASALFGLELNQQDFDLLQQYQDGMIENYDSLKEAFDGIFEKMDGVFEKINEEFDELSSTLDHTASVLESYQNIIELAGASTLGISDAMSLDIMDSRLSVAQTAIKTAKAEFDKNQEMLAEAKEGLAAAQASGDQAQIDKWKESIKLYEEQTRESEQAWLEALANGQELANQRRELAIDTAIKAFAKEMTGYGSMEEWQQAYDQQKALRELYVADYEKAYSLSKLSRQLEKSINETNTVKAKKQLLALEEKINQAKKAGVQMSSYELSNLEREYQIELAKIALEEAQNAKSAVRLRRNAEGSLSYVYTADQNSIDTAQQKYEDAIYASQKANEEWLNSSEEGLMQATANYLESLATIKKSTTMTEEEKNQAILALQEQFIQQQQFYTGQIDTVLANNGYLYNHHITTMRGYYDKNSDNYMTMTDELISSSDRFIFHFEDTLLSKLSNGLLGDANSAQAYFTTLVNNIGDGETPGTLLGDLQAAQDQWEQDTKTNFSNAGMAIDDFRGYVASYLGEGSAEKPGVTKILDNVSQAIDTLMGKTDFTEARSAAEDYGSKVSEAMKTAADQIDNVNIGLTNLITNWGNAEKLEPFTVSYTVNKIETTEEPDTPDGTTNPTGVVVPAPTGVRTTFESSGTMGSGARPQGYGYTDIGMQIRGKYEDYYQSSVGNKWRFHSEYSEILGEDDLKEHQMFIHNNTESNPSKVKQVLNSTIDYDHEHFNDLNLRIVGITSDGQYYVVTQGAADQPSAAKDVAIYIKWDPNDAEYTKLSNSFFTPVGTFDVDMPVGNVLRTVYFDTGGYTGSWGPEGRLAMLHQKEIVLNAHDTENILSVVDMVRQMATQLDFNALTMARGLGNLVANTMVATPQVIDQNVTITAEFPNATNREEIKEAFGDLVNLAAQYASRR